MGLIVINISVLILNIIVNILLEVIMEDLFRIRKNCLYFDCKYNINYLINYDQYGYCLFIGNDVFDVFCDENNDCKYFKEL